jgi:hypothetical protein
MRHDETTPSPAVIDALFDAVDALESAVVIVSRDKTANPEPGAGCRDARGIGGQRVGLCKVAHADNGMASLRDSRHAAENRALHADAQHATAEYPRCERLRLRTTPLRNHSPAQHSGSQTLRYERRPCCRCSAHPALMPAAAYASTPSVSTR